MEAAGGLPPPPPPNLNPTDLDIPPPPTVPITELPPSNTMPPAQPVAVGAPIPPPANPQSDHHDSEDGGSGSEHDDSEEDDDMPRWYPIEEDKSEPCADELEYIKSKGEHSATDHAYWESKAFFAIDDPEITPRESGRIDWLVEGFNGTKENPNNQEVMHSQIQRIDGLDWQIRFYPRGVPGSEYISVFIECVSMLSDDYTAMEDFKDPPFPFLKLASSKQNKIKKRRSVAAQLGMLMYNPDEPRVYEYQAEAHQFHKMSNDYGWKYFTRFPRYEFHIRQHGQRQAILRGDKLAFSAYIRTINDPTGCLWEHGDQSADGITAVTGLRPFSRSLVYTASAIPMLHFAPFRKFARDLPPREGASEWLHPLLLKMYSRKRSPNYGSRGSQYDVDVMEMLWRVANGLPQMYPDSDQGSKFNDLVGSFHAEKGAVCGSNRLNTKDYPSIQAAVDHHQKLIARPALLTLELQRQEHDKNERKWKKLTNKVQCEEKLSVGGTSYTLFAFITHCGHLRSCRYNSYVRPRGPGKGWYAYQDSKVARLTEKQARERHSGGDGGGEDPSRKDEDGYDSPFSEFHEPTSEVTCAVMYVRDDSAEQTFNAPDVEEWVPDFVMPLNDAVDAPIKSALHESFADASIPPPPISAPPAFTEQEFARLQAMATLIDEAATRATPEPVMMDGEDVVMKDADDESNFDIEAQETSPMYDGKVASAGTKDWLGQAYYEGSFNEHGAYHGGGHHIATNGDEYLGEFRDGQYSGYGKLVYALTGNIYEGEFKEGRPEGRGKLTEASSTGNVYEGGFRDGKKHGDFVLTGKVTDEDQSHCHICYDKDITTAFYDCGHVVACRECAAQIDVCPVCRRRVVARLQLYGVRVSNA